MLKFEFRNSLLLSWACQANRTKGYCASMGCDLEDVASGYWTLPVKQSSGLVSHYGSSPSSSARLTRCQFWFAIMILVFDGQCAYWLLPSPA